MLVNKHALLKTDRANAVQINFINTNLRNIIVTNKTILNLGILLTGLFSIASATAGTVVQCGQAVCSASFSIQDGEIEVGGGKFNYDAKTGDISLSQENITGGGTANAGGGITWNLGSGKEVSIHSITGNADPILFFNLGATTGASASNYSFFFDLPIAISGPIDTKSSVSYSLTSKTDAGAQIQGLGGGKVVQSWDIDTSVGGIGVLNKNVDVGDTHFHLGGPATTSSPAYVETDSIVGDLAYDTMSVEVAFNLSAESIVGITGFVSQTPVPVPAAGWLMLTGLGFLTVRKRHTITA